MSKGICPICRKIIIEDLDKYKSENPDEKEVLCPYCGNMITISKIR